MLRWEDSKVDNRNFEYMFYGFLAAWLIIMVYVLSLALREGRLQRELDRIKKMVAKD
jgi:CcmD family protein